MARKTFIRVAEFWLPNLDGSRLEFGGGVFGDCRQFEAATRRLSFGRGEGLPGVAWDKGHPIVLADLADPLFRRSAVAQAEGLNCGIALPLFQHGALRAVVLLFCGDDEDHAGAIELWRNGPEPSPDLTLVDGYYGSTGDTFAFISRATAFRRGTGLPGRVWAEGEPVFLADLGKGSGFLRADGAVKVGINRGFALPCPSTDGAEYVIAFLSALATPIARSVSAWESDGSATGVRRRFGFAEPEGRLEGPAPEDEALLAAQALQSGRPAAGPGLLAMPFMPYGMPTTILQLRFD
jgi:hypothetical protein